ncbi:MAG TPA: MFS transporter [Allocoleopsis sp.]
MKVSRIPSRWWLVMLMSIGICINYIDRVNISHAIVMIADEFKLSAFQQGIVLSAFSWGYVIFMAAGGLLVDRIGAVRTASVAALAWSLATAWTGLASNLAGLFCSRIAVGLGEAPIFPANARIVREEFPVYERGRATALFDAGSYMGTALSAPLVVYTMVSFGWRWSFLACALLGFLWVFLWQKNVPRLQATHSQPTHQPDLGVFWRKAFVQLLTERRVLGASLGFFCYNYAKSFFLTWFPSFLIKERGFSLLSVGYVGLLPPLCAIIGELVAGWATDAMIQRGISVTVARKTPLCLGLLLASTVGFSTVVTSQWVILLLLSFSFTATIAASPGIWAIPGDIAPGPELVGTIGGIQNTFSNVAGIVAPVITGAIVARTGSFEVALIVSATVAILGAFSYWFIVGSLEPISLNTFGENT